RPSASAAPGSRRGTLARRSTPATPARARSPPRRWRRYATPWGCHERALHRQARSLRGTARSSPAPHQEERGADHRHPDRHHHRPVPGDAGGSAGAQPRRGGRVPGDGGDPHLHQEPDAPAAGPRRGGGGRGGSAGGAGPAASRVSALPRGGSRPGIAPPARSRRVRGPRRARGRGGRRPPAAPGARRLPALLGAVRVVLPRLRPPPAHAILSPGLSVAQCVERILARFALGSGVEFADVFSPESGRGEVIVTFLALLELIRLKVIR